MKQTYTVTGMTCSACSAHVDKAVRKVAGVEEVNVNLLGGSMQVTGDADPGAVIKAVTDAGYGASLPAGKGKKTAPAASAADASAELKHMKRHFILSLCFLLPLFYLSMGHMMGLPIPAFFHGRENALAFALTQFLLTLPILYLNDKYYKVGFKTLLKGAPNMDSLIALGSAAAMIYGIVALFQIGYGLGRADWARVDRWRMDLYFESAGMILTLITLGKFLETRSKGRTGEAIARLIDLSPKTATVLRNGTETEIPVEEVQVGDLVVVKPGASVPVDGQVFEGASSVDESALTGESIPVEKGPGDKVIAASINKSGSFTLKATRVGEDTTLAQMIALVEEAASSKAPIAKLADKVSGVFVPVVICISIVTAIVWLATGHSVEMALTSAVAVLVISCPCALGLATPVAIMVGTGKGAENGMLFKSAEALETLHTVNTVVLDKTGTVTQGHPTVTGVYPGEGVTAEELVCIAASLEKPSEHPLAEAIVAEAGRRAIPLAPVTDFLAVHGRGIQGKIQGEAYIAGNRAFLEEQNIAPGAFAMIADRLAEEGKTSLYFAGSGGMLGVIAVSDPVKPTSAEAIRAFGEMGVEVVLLTGDNRRTAAAVGRSLGIGNVVAEVLPQDKQAKVKELQEAGRRVTMVGDGINDAPALVQADVGMAIGAGADVAIESADVVLMKSDLRDAVTAIRLSRAVIRNIKQNLFWAFFYNSIGIPLAAGVFYMALNWQLNPMFAAAAMSMSSVTVVSNALRLRFFKAGNGAEIGPRPAAEAEPKETKGAVIMEKKILIEGMMCPMCRAHVEKALNGLEGVACAVDLEARTATVTGDLPTDEVLTKTVTDAGYKVIEIK